MQAVMAGSGRAFGERVRELRKRRGLTQRECAQAVGIHVTYLSKVECGRAVLREQKLARLAKVLKAAPQEFLMLGGKVPDELRRCLTETVGASTEPAACRLPRKDWSLLARVLRRYLRRK
jgi:transcriptional regulator with XRE-family HTH domain